MEDPKVSIIIPVYNTEKHLRQCLNSLVSQTITEIEIICVDDGSTDNSLTIIKEYNEKDDRIIYFSMIKNSGSGLARNEGIKRAKGEYISFVDADDHIINTNCYEEIYKFAHKNNADMVSTNLKSFNNDGKYFQNKHCFEIKYESPILPQDYGIPWYHQKNLYKRSFIINKHIEYPNYKRGQDPVFLANVLINLDLVYCLPIDFYAYRTIGVKKINSKDKELDYIKHFQDVLELLNTETFKETYLNYEKRLYHHFVSANSFSDESVQKSVKTVFGENSKIYTIYKLKKKLQEKEKEIEKLKSASKNEDNLVKDLNLNLDDKLNVQIKYFIEEIYEKLYKKNVDKSIRQRLISKFPSLYILLNRNNNTLKSTIINLKGYKTIKNNKLFDIGYYLRNNPDVRKSGEDPLLHYIIHGFKEYRNPNLLFDNKSYLNSNSDVKNFKLNPLVHYSLYGQKEKRKIKSNQEISVENLTQVYSPTYRKEVIEITFNNPIKPGTKFIELKNNKEELIPVKIKFLKNKIYLIPLKSLSKSTEYKLVLHSNSITDIFNHPLEKYSTNIFNK